MLRSNSFSLKTHRAGAIPIRLKASDISLLRNTYKALDSTKSNSVDLDELLRSIEHSGPSYDSLRSHFHLVQDQIKSNSKGQMTFLELVILLCPGAPANELEQTVRQYAPSLYDSESKNDLQVQEGLDRMGQPRSIEGETRQSRRIRLAISRATSVTSPRTQPDPLDASQMSRYMAEQIQAIPKTKTIHKPIIRVSFQKRSDEASRLMEYSTLRRPLLSMDGLPLHAHPALQLQSGIDDLDDEVPKDEHVVRMRKSGSNQLFDRKARILPRDTQPEKSVRLRKAKVGSFYAHLFHKQLLPETDRQKLLSQIANYDIEQAALLFQNLIEQKLLIEPALLRAIMHGGLKCERSDITIRCFMLATSAEGDPSPGKHTACPDPDLSCYNALIEAYGCAGNMEAALNVRGLLSSNKLVPNGETYNSWIRAAVINDKMKLVKKFLHEMDRNGFIYSLSRDIKHSLGETAVQSILEKHDSLKSDNRKLVSLPRSIPHDTKYDLKPLKQESDQVFKSTSASMFAAEVDDLEQELSERIATFRLTAKVLNEEGICSEECLQINSKLRDLEKQMNELQIIKAALECPVIQNDFKDAEQMKNLSKHCFTCESGDSLDTFLSIDSDPMHSEQVNSNVSGEMASMNEKAESYVPHLAPGMKIILKQGTSEPRSISSQIDFVVRRPPFLITKTITATPKSHSTGEFIIVVTIMLNEPVQSHRGDKITIDIKGFKNIPTDDCDLPIFGVGSRLCVNGGAKWNRSNGCISMDIVENAVVPSEIPAVFRFSLSVDTEIGHPPITPTISMYNRSRSFDTGEYTMEGEILHYLPSTSKRLKTVSLVRKQQSLTNFSLNENNFSLGKKVYSSAKISLAGNGLHQTINFVDWGCNLGSGEIKQQEYCLDYGFVNPWRPNTIKVFLSTSAGNTQKERAHLYAKVFPSIRQLCETARMVLIVVDLRDGETSGEFKEKWALKTLLDEAKDCHYFISLIGENYGWHQNVQIDPLLFEEVLRLSESLPIQCKRIPGDSSQGNDDVKPFGKSEVLVSAVQNARLKCFAPGSPFRRPMLRRMPSQRSLVTDELRQKDTAQKQSAVPLLRPKASSRFIEVQRSCELAENRAAVLASGPLAGFSSPSQPPSTLLPIIAVGLDKRVGRGAETNTDDTSSESTKYQGRGSKLSKTGSFRLKSPKNALRGGTTVCIRQESDISEPKRIRVTSRSTTPTSGFRSCTLQPDGQNQTISSFSAFAFTGGTSTVHQMFDRTEEEFALSRLPPGSDVNFFLNQVHAIKNNHMWILDHLDSGIVELEILHRLKADISSQHRCLIFLRVHHRSDTKSVEESHKHSESLLQKEASIKLHTLTKRLNSGEFGRVQVQEYEEPIAGSELLGRHLENLIRADWLDGQAKQNSYVNINLLRLEEDHKSFGLACLVDGTKLHLQPQRFLTGWLSRSETDAPFILHGAKGSGKTAFLAQFWKAEVSNKDWGSTMAHFAEADSSAVTAMIRCCAALTCSFRNLENLPGRFRELCSLFSVLQNEEASNVAITSRPLKVLLILDSINELLDESGAGVPLFEYLPKKLASHVKMVLSVNSDREVMSWPITHQWTMCELPSLSKSDSLNLAQSYLKGNSWQAKLLNLDSLEFGQSSFQTRAVMLSLFTLRSFNVLLHNDGVFFDSNSVNHVWAMIIQASEIDHGAGIVRSILISLSLSRHGMSLEELCAFLKFMKGKIPGDANVHPDLSSINSMIVSAVLWPLKSTNNLWFRGNLINLRANLKAIIVGHYFSGQTGHLWHELFGDFFAQATTHSGRVVQEFPYHMMKANCKDRLKQFLCHPQWSAEMICCFHCADLFQYWRFTGKTVLTNSYTRVLFKPQCWGCTCLRNQSEVWMDQFIRHGLLSHLKATRIADSLEKEIFQRTGKKLWSREDILEHIRFHNIQESQPVLMANPTRADKPSTATKDAENMLDWDDGNTIQCLRIAVQILRDSIDLITVESIAKLKEGKLRLSKAEEMGNIIPKELSKLVGVTRVLLMLDMEHFQCDTKSPLRTDILEADACEITVESVADLGNIGIASFPLPVKVGNEVMTATKLEGNTFTVIRSNHRRQSHRCWFLVNFVIKLDTENRHDSTSSAMEELALWLEVNTNQIEISNLNSANAIRDESSIITSEEGESEKKCCVRCLTESEAAGVKLKLETLSTSNGNRRTQTPAYPVTQAKFEIIDRLTTEIYRPYLYTEIAVPNRLLAQDHYWCAHFCYLLQHFEDCENHLKKCIDILVQICHQTDHLLVQSEVFCWLLLVECGSRRAARQKAQDLVNLEKAWFQTNKMAEFRITTLSKRLLKIAREADDIMNGDTNRFNDKLIVVKTLLAPKSLFELESSAFMDIDGMWLSIHIEEARDLFPMDLNGTDDPFCTVSLNCETKSTATHMRTLNAIFDEELVFFRVQPDPDMCILLDLWDWDGPGRQDLIGYSQLSLRSALEREGETVVFNLSRMIKGRGVQADGIKVGNSGMCGYLSVRFEFSNILRQALFNSRQRVALQEAVQHQVVNSKPRSIKYEFARCITLLEPERWDETVPISTSDESAWMSRFVFLYRVRNVEKLQVNSGAILDAAKVYFAACKKLEVSPHAEVLKSLERMISFGVTSIWCFHNLVKGEEDAGCSILAAMSVLEQLKSITCLELGSCKIDGPLALKLAPLLAQQSELHSLFLQSNVIGDSSIGLKALQCLVASTSYCHLRVLCLAHNRLQDYDIANLLCKIPTDSHLQSFDISHNNGRTLSALAISWLLKSSIGLKELNFSWNQLGSYSQSNFENAKVEVLLDVMESPVHAAFHHNKLQQYETLQESLTCRETLLLNDTEGRWARHFLLNNKLLRGFEESLGLICQLLNSSKDAEVFLSAYSNYIHAAQAVQSAHDSYTAHFHQINSTEPRMDQIQILGESPRPQATSSLQDSELQKNTSRYKIV